MTESEHRTEFVTLCAECGSADVQGVDWCYVNTGVAVQGGSEAFYSDDPQMGQTWCDACEAHVTLVTEEFTPSEATARIGALRGQARLIAAAPALLEALESLADTVMHVHAPSLSKYARAVLTERARAALALASPEAV